MESDKIIKRKTKNGFSFLYKGKIISRSKFWIMKMKDKIKQKKELSLNLKLSPTDQKKLIVLQKIWNTNSPSNTIKALINEYFSLINLKKIQEKVQRKNG